MFVIPSLILFSSQRKWESERERRSERERMCREERREGWRMPITYKHCLYIYLQRDRLMCAECFVGRLSFVAHRVMPRCVSLSPSFSFSFSFVQRWQIFSPFSDMSQLMNTSRSVKPTMSSPPIKRKSQSSLISVMKLKQPNRRASASLAEHSPEPYAMRSPPHPQPLSSSLSSSSSSSKSAHDQRNKAREIVHGLQRKNIKLIAIDFDHTFLSIHTGGYYQGTVEKSVRIHSTDLLLPAARNPRFAGIQSDVACLYCVVFTSRGSHSQITPISIQNFVSRPIDENRRFRICFSSSLCSSRKPIELWFDVIRPTSSLGKVMIS